MNAESWLSRIDVDISLYHSVSQVEIVYDTAGKLPWVSINDVDSSLVPPLPLLFERSVWTLKKSLGS